jgi:D-glucuronyl C5-epimerase C-terminus
VLRVAVVAGVLAGVLGCAGAAQAGTVLRVDQGKARVAHDPLLPPASKTRLPAVSQRTRLLAPRVVARAAALPSAQQLEVDAALAEARSARDALPAGPARDELAGVVANVEALSASGQLTSSRVAATLMTLRRNTEFWRLNQPPAPGTRVVFASSPVLLEYYRGEGLQIQPLGNFGKANAAWSACRSRGDRTCPALQALLDAMIALAAERGTFTAWEYYFDFEGGVPPWTSGMSQGTAIQALARAYDLTRLTRYRDAAAAAIGAFQTAPPTGVAVPGPGGGTHYLMYSYAPQLFIFNGFLQSLIGLDVYRDLTGDTRASALYQAGFGNARVIIPLSDTGSWSLYSLGGPESTVDYHTLLRDFLDTLCRRRGNAVYCDTAARFARYLEAGSG